MLKIFNNRILIIVFVVLLAVAATVQLISSQKGERNFREYLAQVDTAAIDKISFKNFNDDKLIITKTGKETWQVKQNKRKAPADQGAMANLLKALSNLKVKKRVAIKASQWKKYEVTDSLGTRVKIFTNGDIAADLMVGRFSYKRMGQGLSMSTNARLADEDEVYTVEGQLSMMTRRDFNGFRDHTLLKVNPELVNEIKFQYPADSSFTLRNNGKQWMAGNNPADSVAVDAYLQKLKGINARNFTKTFSPGNKTVFKMQVKLNNGQSHQVEAYSEGEKYTFRTSQNEGAIFTESEKTFDKIFQSSQKLKI